MAKKRALIGMSGGVDSSVAACLALDSGYDCSGGTMRLHDFGCGGSDDCRADSALKASCAARFAGVSCQ